MIKSMLCVPLPMRRDWIDINQQTHWGYASDYSDSACKAKLSVETDTLTKYDRFIHYMCNNHFNWFVAFQLSLHVLKICVKWWNISRIKSRNEHNPNNSRISHYHISKETLYIYSYLLQFRRNCPCQSGYNVKVAQVNTQCIDNLERMWNKERYVTISSNQWWFVLSYIAQIANR